jgi:hypothetical protein
MIERGKTLAAPQPVQGPAGSQPAQIAAPMPYSARMASPEGFEKDFLDYFFRVGRVAQDTPGRAEHGRPVLVHQPIPVGHRGSPYGRCPGRRLPISRG